MDDSTWKRIEHLFYEVIERAPAERPAFLDEACGDDHDLRHRVETLLARHTQTGHLFDAPGALVEELLRELAGSMSIDVAVAGRTIGPYRIEREIGSGGMGRVFLAWREDLPKKVALKLVREPLASPDRIRRFRFEQRVLAGLEHPNIAQLLDAGVTDDGAPYFAMELVDGEPLPSFCDRRRLTIVQRLRLFLDVCSAVRYAHAHLVVHRDVKPSNVLVTRDGRPKLLDFGVAKLLTGQADAELTGTGTRVFTPSYAAPEQLAGGPVSTGTDVYQLGALLYVLVAGRPPLDVAGESPGVAERIVREREPAAPSSSVVREVPVTDSAGATETSMPAEIAAERSTTSERLRQQLRGDIDNIVLKALEKRPERRYASVEAFANDIERFLQGRPVLARDGGRIYRLRKLVRRHRWGLATAAGFVLAVGTFGTVYTVRVTHERSRAQQEAEKSAQVTDFLMSLFEASDPREARGASTSAGELLARGLTQVETLEAQPEVQAQMLDVMGRVYRRLGDYNEARRLLERAVAMRRELLGEAHPDLAQSVDELARVLKDLGDYEAAEPLYREALTMRRELYGEEHPDVAQSLNSLGMLVNDRGDYEVAERLYRDALAMRRRLLGEEHVDVASTMNNLGLLLMERGDYDQAEAIHREALAMRRKLLGEDHLDVTYSLNNLALVLHTRGDYDAAEPLYRELIALDRKLLGEEHPDYALDLNNLGGLLQNKGDYEGADSLHRRALAIYRKALGPVHPRIAQSLNNLAGVSFRRNDYEAAEPLYREALAMRRELLGEEHPAVATTLNNLGALLRERGDYAGAELLFREALAMRRELLGPVHADVALSLHGLASVLLLGGDAESAASLYRQAVEINGTSLGATHAVTAYYESGLAASLTALGLYAEAERLLLAADTVLQRARGDDAPGRYADEVRERLVTLYEAWGKPEEAARYRASPLRAAF